MNNGNKKTVLLVEDEVIIAMMEKKELEKYGYIVHHVTTGEKTVQTILEEDFPIDLILMDIDLGSGIDGTQAAAEILKHKDIPIVFLSSHTEPGVVEKTEKITSYGYVVKNTGIVVLDASIKMAFKLFDAKMSQKQKEEELRKSEYKYRMLFENMNVSFGLHEAIYDDNGNPIDFRYLDMNPMFLNNLGFTDSAIRGHTAKELFPNTEQYWIDTFGDVAKTGESVSFQNYSCELDQWFNTFVFSPQKNQFASFFIDITEQKKAEEAFKREDIFLSSILDNVKEAIIICNENGEIIRFNEAARRLHNLPEKQIPAEQWAEYYDLYSPDGSTLLATEDIPLFRALEGEDVINVEIMVAPKDSNHHYLLSCNGCQLINTEGKITGAVITMFDVTERKQAEEEIKKQLAEKETLLREVHHRVKNNIANIESLLSLQAGSTVNDEVKKALQDAISRIQSMRVLYEKLLLSKDIDEISIKDYAESLIGSLVMFFDPEKNIIIEKHFANFEVDARKAVSIGIIINELLTNVFKYAFKNRDSGMVSVSIDSEGNRVTLIIQDNGIGIDERIEANKSPGFGLTIVKMLVEQLKGTYSLVNENGTKSVIQFEI